ncbi:hypothetical protein [Streptomyces noursei]|uniref:hypothetical protein n=1 Tax=Streptomyces noursei TaxID=1971 RepID=UPI00167B298D|nr:hypothetical protein [Streptomyces noursei]MCZ1013960.1 hypothetical protein [Streptomyces noursei]GGX40568.1 hypothetical protein GCM10010341_73130 [Streptomyces noursei]
MSALGTKLHALIGRFTSVAHKDVEEIVTAVEQHLVPVIRSAVHDALTAAEADGRSLLDQLRADEGRLAQAVAAEVAQILGRTTTPPGGAA